MLGTKNVVFESADWLPEEMNGDRSETETCFSLFSCPSPLSQRKKKYLHSSWFRQKSKSHITHTAADIFEAGIFEM